MVAELGLHGTVDFANLIVENDIVELLDHLTGAERAERSAALALSESDM